MLWPFFKRKIKDYAGLFNGHFVDAKALYALEFDAVSCISFIGELDTSKAFSFINNTLESDVVETWQHSYFDHKEQKQFFNNTIFVLKDKRMIELGNNWCQVLHTPKQYEWAANMIESLSRFKLIHHEPVIGFARHAGVAEQ